jgi:hypothetical protein
LTINPDRYFRTLKTLDTFVDRALDLMPNAPNLSGFNYDLDLLYAAVANTYIETVGSHADSLHLAIQLVPILVPPTDTLNIITISCWSDQPNIR